MKKLLTFTLALTVMFGCACSMTAKPSGNRRGPVSDTDEADETDVVVEDIHFDYPDQIVTKPGGTAGMTVYKCGILYYACVDGNTSWAELYNSLPIELEEGTFVHVEADYDLKYGGIDHYWGTMSIKEVRDEYFLTLDEVADYHMIEPYDPDISTFDGPRLLEKDGRNYLLCRDPMRQYRLYDDNANLLCKYDTSMACAAYLEYGEDQDIIYGSVSYPSCWVMRIGDVYYAYSRNGGNSKWTPLLNKQFENKPIGFELTDGQAMKVDSTTMYLVNSPKYGYVNAPMFETMEDFYQINYDTIINETCRMHWEEASSYENGILYQYFYGLDQYLIFYLDDRFYVYHENYCDINTDEFIGVFMSADEVNEGVGR